MPKMAISGGYMAAKYLHDTCIYSNTCMQVITKKIPNL